MAKDNTDDLLDVLRDLSNNYELTDESSEEFYIKLKNIYSNEDFRHSYAKLSRFAEKEITPDAREQLVHNLDSILRYADEFVGNGRGTDSDVIKKIKKLEDHLELESIRLSRMEQIKIIGEKVFLEKADAESIIKENEGKILKQQEEIKNMNTQMVSVLGIFAAVVVAFFGGMSYFTSAFSNINEAPLYKTLIITSILGMVICDSIYMLLNFIFIILRQDKIHRGKVFGNWVIKLVNIVLVIMLIIGIVVWRFSQF